MTQPRLHEELDMTRSNICELIDSRHEASFEHVLDYYDNRESLLDALSRASLPTRDFFKFT